MAKSNPHDYEEQPDNRKRKAPAAPLEPPRECPAGFLTNMVLVSAALAIKAHRWVAGSSGEQPDNHPLRTDTATVQQQQQQHGGEHPDDHPVRSDTTTRRQQYRQRGGEEPLGFGKCPASYSSAGRVDEIRNPKLIQPVDSFGPDELKKDRDNALLRGDEFKKRNVELREELENYKDSFQSLSKSKSRLDDDNRSVRAALANLESDLSEQKKLVKEHREVGEEREDALKRAKGDIEELKQKCKELGELVGDKAAEKSKEKVRLEAANQQLRSEAERYIKQERSTHQANIAECERHYRQLLGQAEQEYNNAALKHTQDTDAKDAELAELRQQLESQAELLKSVNTNATDKDQRIASLEQQLFKEQAASQSKDTDINQKDTMIGSLRQQLQHQQAVSAPNQTVANAVQATNHISALHAQLNTAYRALEGNHPTQLLQNLEQKEKQLNVQNTEWRIQRTQLKDKDTQLEEKDKQLKQQDKQLKDQEEQLNEARLQNPLNWDVGAYDSSQVQDGILDQCNQPCPTCGKVWYMCRCPGTILPAEQMQQDPQQQSQPATTQPINSFNDAGQQPAMVQSDHSAPSSTIDPALLQQSLQAPSQQTQPAFAQPDQPVFSNQMDVSMAAVAPFDSTHTNQQGSLTGLYLHNQAALPQQMNTSANLSSSTALNPTTDTAMGGVSAVITGDQSNQSQPAGSLHTAQQLAQSGNSRSASTNAPATAVRPEAQSSSAPNAFDQANNQHKPFGVTAPSNTFTVPSSAPPAQPGQFKKRSNPAEGVNAATPKQRSTPPTLSRNSGPSNTQQQATSTSVSNTANTPGVPASMTPNSASSTAAPDKNAGEQMDMDMSEAPRKNEPQSVGEVDPHGAIKTQPTQAGPNQQNSQAGPNAATANQATAAVDNSAMDIQNQLARARAQVEADNAQNPGGLALRSGSALPSLQNTSASSRRFMPLRKSTPNQRNGLLAPTTGSAGIANSGVPRPGDTAGNRSTFSHGLGQTNQAQRNAMSQSNAQGSLSSNLSSEQHANRILSMLKPQNTPVAPAAGTATSGIPGLGNPPGNPTAHRNVTLDPTLRTLGPSSSTTSMSKSEGKKPVTNQNKVSQSTNATTPSRPSPSQAAQINGAVPSMYDIMGGIQTGANPDPPKPGDITPSGRNGARGLQAQTTPPRSSPLTREQKADDDVGSAGATRQNDRVSSSSHTHENSQASQNNHANENNDTNMHNDADDSDDQLSVHSDSEFPLADMGPAAADSFYK